MTDEHFKVLANQNYGFPLVKCRGYWIVAFCLPSFEHYYNFSFRSSDVIVVSPPKCGTHWLYYTCYLIATKNFGAIPKHQQRCMLEFMQRDSTFEGDMLGALINEPDRRVIGTHMPGELLPKNVFDANVIYIYRNPWDVCVSLFFHQKSNLSWPCDFSFEQWVQVFMDGETVCGPYPKHLKSMLQLKQNGKRILFISYEDLKAKPEATVNRIAEFLGVTLTDAEVVRILKATSVESMRDNNEANGQSWRQNAGAWDEKIPFIRKGVVGSWRETFASNNQLLEQFNNYVKEQYPESMGFAKYFD